jgi:hypothetical protein
MECKRFLESLAPSERALFIGAAEARRKGDILRDSIENDPTVRPLFLAAREEATGEVQEWHRRRITELEQSAPAVASMLRSGRRLCHRIWARTKEILRERHGIEWRSPGEMNPWVVFD